MSVAKAVVNRPVLWLVVFALVVITGIFLLSGIAVEMFPEINMPVLIVITAYPGADPEIVESSVTMILESALSTTSGINNMYAFSQVQMSMIVLRFEFGTDLDQKSNRVREIIDRTKSQLPSGIIDPMIMQMNPDDQPIMRIAVRGVQGSGSASGRSLTENELRAFAINELEDRFTQIEGVASTSTEGGQDRIVRAALAQNRLESYGITITEIARLLSAQNLSLGAGFIDEGFIEYSITTSGQFESVDQIANVAVMQIGGADIRLQDIGEVGFDYKDERSAVFINGEPSVYISIMKQSGANTIMVADKVYAELENLKSILPQNILLELTQDSSIQTRSMVNELLQSALSGILLAMAVLFFFLRNFKASIIVGLAIPISFVVTLLVMSIAGITINMMTLAGLILSLGITVDSSIVVIESIMAYREKGEKKKMAGILAGEEVMSSLITGAITLLCVFVPIILFRNQLEFIGILVQDMIFTIAISISAALCVGIFLVPVLATKWLPVDSRVQKPLTNPLLAKIDTSITNGITFLTNAYKGLLANALKHRLVTCILVLAAFFGSVLALGRMDITMMPDSEGDEVTVTIEMPIGTRYEETKAVALAIQDFAIGEINGYKNIITSVGSSGQAMGGDTVNAASVTIVLDLDNPHADSENDVRRKLRPFFANFPNANLSLGGMDIMALMAGSDIDIELRVADLREGMATANAIKTILETKVPEVHDIAVNMNEGLPQLSIKIDRDRAYNLGLNVATVALEISAAMNGTTATTYRERGIEYDVILQLAKEDRHEIPDLGRIFVRSSRGMLIPVSNFADIEFTEGPESIYRRNQVRTINVTASVREGFMVKDVEDKIALLLDEQGISAHMAGAMESTMKMVQTFLLVIILALLLVYGVMAAQYESFRDPFINFCTIPLLLIGVVLIHLITGNPISAFTMIAIVLLIGLAVMNGILLVDYTNQLRRKGVELTEACIAAGSARFRPVLMTSLTTMLGMAPMAFFSGDSASITAPVGLAVFGGLASAAVITLVFVPVLYSIFHGKQKEEANEE